MTISLETLRVVEGLNQLAKELPNNPQGFRELQAEVHRHKGILMQLPLVASSEAGLLHRRIVELVKQLPRTLGPTPPARSQSAPADFPLRFRLSSPPPLHIVERAPSPPPPYTEEPDSANAPS